ncbi:MAG: leucine-rich repeat domain-containing protein [Erysipelotrichales bacterium]|nr:leucine-rich repeat domain-containing protein [Erysipelotrichales bacterium]
MNKLTKCIVVIFLLMAMLPSVYATNEMVDRGTLIPNDQNGIADTALYEYIKIQTGKNEVYSNDLENITTLKLSDKIYSIKSLDGLSLMNMPNLFTLELDISTLSTLDEVVKLNQVKELIILNSSLTELPDTLKDMEGLNVLELHNSPIEELTGSFYDIPFLDTIVLDSLPLTELSDSIKDMKFMEHLELYSMDIEIPEAIYDMNRLRTLKMENMGLESVSDSIYKLERLEELSLANNKIESISNKIYDLTALHSLNLRNNRIQEIDGGIERLYNLEVLDVSQNMLTTLPLQITSLNSLKELHINDNLIDCLESDFGLLKLEGVYDFFEYNEIAKCDYVEEEPVLETTILSVLHNVVQSNGYTNQDVTIVSNNEVYFVVNMVMRNEPLREITISEEGSYKVDAVIDGLGTVATISFTIDRTAPVLKIKDNDLQQEGFATDIAIESNEAGVFYVNEVNHGELSMLLLSDDGDYEVYAVDEAGNKSNVLSFYIEKQNVENEITPISVEKEVSYVWYFAYAVFVVVASFGTYWYLRKGIEMDNA